MSHAQNEPTGHGLTRRQALRIAGGATAAAVVIGGGRHGWADRPEAQAASLEALADRLPRTAAVIAKAAEAGKPGQLYLVHEGAVVADVAWGTGPHGEEMRPDTLVGWASAPWGCGG